MRENGSILESLQNNRVSSSKVSPFIKGKSYVLNQDYPYDLMDEIIDYIDNYEKLIINYVTNYRKDEWIYFTKGMSFEFVGMGNRGEYLFKLDNIIVPFVDAEVVRKCKVSIKELFREV